MGLAEVLKYRWDEVLAYGGISVLIAGLGYAAFEKGGETWNDMELDRQEGLKAAFTTENTLGTSNIACMQGVNGDLQLQEVDTGAVFNNYVIQGQDAEHCYFTDGPHRPTGSQVFNAPIL